MKNITTLKAFMLSLMMAVMMLPIASFAQNDNIIQNWDDENGVRDFALTWTITNNSFGTSPLGSGLLVLTAVGAGYAVAKRRRNRKNGTMMLLALAMIVGMTGCRKKVVEPIVNPSSNGTTYTINLKTGNGSKVNVTGADVTFTIDDQILVAHNGRYVGALTYTEYETGKYRFQGTITTEVADPKQKLYFYFLGNKIDVSTLTPGTSGSTSCTVNISDQTGYPALPVISFSASNEDFSGNGSYSAALNNKCSLMKFNVTTPSTSPICITGMNNKVTVLFNDRSVNDGFSYSVDSEDGGLIKLKGGSGSPAEKWAIVLPQDALTEGEAGTAYTNGYSGVRPAIPAITADQYLNSGIAMTVNTASNILDLSTVTEDYTINNGWTVIGTLAGNYKISIADGASVTLDNATINGVNSWDYEWAGITCLGDATIILEGTNTVKGFQNSYPGIQAAHNYGAGDEYTLTIQGTGSLTASSNGRAAGIGGGPYIECGNITISGGTITATGGDDAAGIGSGEGRTCGNITISNGTVTATGGSNAAGIGTGGTGASCGNISISGGIVTATGGSKGAGIGTGKGMSCGNITITSDVTIITATKGSGASNSIGMGYQGTCGTVTIGGVEGAITESPYTYTPPIPSAPTGAINGLFSVSSTKQVYFSQGNLQAVGTTSSSPSSGWTWQFAEHQYDYIGGRSDGGSEDQTGNNYISGDGSLSANGTVDLFCWSTNTTYYGIHNGEYSSTYSGEFYDWGNAIGSGWRTLTPAEWEWILGSSGSPTPGTNCRTSSTVNGVENARYAKATVADKAGLIIFPDSYTHPGDVTAPASVNTADAAYNSNSYDATAWGKIEAAGAVFLPAAGNSRRVNENNIIVADSEFLGFYWSTVPYGNDWAYHLMFFPALVEPSGYSTKNLGFSVRLVKDAN